MEGVPETEAREALRLAAHKLSIKTRFVKRVRGGGRLDEAASKVRELSADELKGKEKELQEQLFSCASRSRSASSTTR